MTAKTKLMKWTKQSAYEDLRKRIVLQDLEPGASLYEKTIMQTYDIGRTPLREILLDLKRDRFVQMIPNRGTFVTSMDIKEMKSAMEMRVPLENLAVELAIDRISAKEIESLENLLSSVKRLNSKDKEHHRDLLLRESEFHNKIYKATYNDLLSETLYQIQTISIRFWMYIAKGSENIYPLFNDLKELLEAIKKKDKRSAVKIITIHVSKSHELLKQYV